MRTDHVREESVGQMVLYLCAVAQGDAGPAFYSEHKENKVGLVDESRIPELKRLLACLAAGDES